MANDEEEVTPPEPTDELFEKRRLRTKVKVIRRERTKADYKRVQVSVDGQKRSLSQSSKFFLDNLINDDDVNPED